MTCPARIRPFPDDTELVCDRADPHLHEHRATLRDYAYPGSSTTITWQESDRRTFRGQWMPCRYEDCTLPDGHRGNHAP